MSRTQELKAQFTGQTLDDVPTPAAILDLAKLELNCQRMLQAAEHLGIGFRAHIKTHKTTELTRLQVGDAATTPVNIIVSTVVEAEKIVPLLKEYQTNGREVNVLYSFPLHASGLSRLAKVSSELGSLGLSVMIDHIDQLPYLVTLAADSGNKPLVFLKVDMGYKRAGVLPGTSTTRELITELLSLERNQKCIFHGLYTHAGNSYETRHDWDAMGHLQAEFNCLETVAQEVRSLDPGHALTLSVGATPSATTIQHPTFREGHDPGPGDDTPQARAWALSSQFIQMKNKGYALEIHAGVYPTLDLQQLATHARDSDLLSHDDIAITVLAEVASIYPKRGDGETAEALINAGSLALGREPCKDLGHPKGVHYSGWGILMPWKLENPTPTSDFPALHGGWQVGRISQEHGILVWHGTQESQVPLAVGQRVRVWPNHSCIAGAGHDWYLVVDSRNKGREDVIVDVWPRWRGW